MKRWFLPDAVFDGEQLSRGAAVAVDGGRIVEVSIDAVGGAGDSNCRRLEGATLLPGLIDLHTHLLLVPYGRRSWDDQIMRDQVALRVARAVDGARRTLDAGFTTVRDLGT